MFHLISLRKLFMKIDTKKIYFMLLINCKQKLLYFSQKLLSLCRRNIDCVPKAALLFIVRLWKTVRLIVALPTL